MKFTLPVIIERVPSIEADFSNPIWSQIWVNEYAYEYESKVFLKPNFVSQINNLLTHIHKYLLLYILIG